LPPEDLPGTTPALPLISVFPYHSPASRVLLNFKFRNRVKHAPSIGYAMADAFLAYARHTEPDGGAWLFCCVPMTQEQVSVRGYNQSELLARYAARWAGADFLHDALQKNRATEVQHNLPAAEREKNVHGAFAAAKAEKLLGRRVALCDDICTTGATLRAAVAALVAAGAAEVVCLTFLRTERDANKEERK
ncbi:MAG: hypothetical protein LBB50_03280, partial [Oscillospiraceae bacterium]|jgi:ComF family protein|nr:hypothetical protein [Oscillospiraceae bacterium]